MKFSSTSSTTNLRLPFPAARLRTVSLTSVATLVGVWAFCLYLAFTMGAHPQDILAEKAVAIQTVEGGNPYAPLENISDVDGFWSAPRTPGAHLVLAPLAWIPEPVLIPATTVLIVTSLVLIVFLSIRMTGVSDLWILATPLLMFTEPGLAVRHTNLAPVVCLAVVVAWFAAKRGDFYLAGIPLGLAATMRLFPLWVALAFLIGGRRRIAAAAGGVFVGLNLVGLLLPAVTVAGTVEVLSQAEFYGWTANVSLAALTDPWISARVVAIVLLAGLATWLAVRRPQWRRGLAAVPLALLAGPVTWAMYLPAVGPLIPGKMFIPIVVLWSLPSFGVVQWPVTLSLLVIAVYALRREETPGPSA